jgi:hypothetical protein
MLPYALPASWSKSSADLLNLPAEPILLAKSTAAVAFYNKEPA